MELQARSTKQLAKTNKPTQIQCAEIVVTYQISQIGWCLLVRCGIRYLRRFESLDLQFEPQWLTKLLMDQFTTSSLTPQRQSKLLFDLVNGYRPMSANRSLVSKQFSKSQGVETPPEETSPAPRLDPDCHAFWKPKIGRFHHPYRIPSLGFLLASS